MSAGSGFMSRMNERAEENVRVLTTDKEVIRMFVRYLKPQVRTLAAAMSALCSA